MWKIEEIVATRKFEVEGLFFFLKDWKDLTV